MMKSRLVLLGTAVLCVIGFAARSAPAAPATAQPSMLRIRVTPDNFVSLDFQFQGDEGNTHVVLQGNTLSQSVDQPAAPAASSSGSLFGGSGSGLGWPVGGNETRTAPLSTNQLRELFSVLGDIQIPTGGPGMTATLGGGGNTAPDVLTLVVSDDKNRDQRFIIQNQGKPKLKWYASLLEYLERLRTSKFANGMGGPGSTGGLVNRDNFISVTLVNVGGIAGIRTQTDIRAYTPPTDLGAGQFSRVQIIGQRTNMDKKGVMTLADLDALIKVLNSARLPVMNGQKYTQNGLTDGLNEQLIVTLTNGRSYTVENYGNQAPDGYYKVTKYIDDFIEAKTGTGFRPLE